MVVGNADTPPQPAAVEPFLMQQDQAQAALLINNDNYVALPPRDVNNAFDLAFSDNTLQDSHNIIDDDDDDEEEDESPLTEEEQRFRKACLAVCQYHFTLAELDFDNCDFRSTYRIPLIDQLHNIGMPAAYWDSIVLTYDAYLAEEKSERFVADMLRAADSQCDSFALTSSTTVAPEHVEQRLNTPDQDIPCFTADLSPQADLAPDTALGLASPVVTAPPDFGNSQVIPCQDNPATSYASALELANSFRAARLLSAFRQHLFAQRTGRSRVLRSSFDRISDVVHKRLRARALHDHHLIRFTLRALFENVDFQEAVREILFYGSASFERIQLFRGKQLLRHGM